MRGGIGGQTEKSLSRVALRIGTATGREMVLQLQALALPVMRAILSYLGEDPLSFDRKLTRETSRNSLRPRACPRAFGAQRTALLPPCRRARAWLCARYAALRARDHARVRPRVRAATRGAATWRWASQHRPRATLRADSNFGLRLNYYPPLSQRALASGAGVPPRPMPHGPRVSRYAWSIIYYDKSNLTRAAIIIVVPVHGPLLAAVLAVLRQPDRGPQPLPRAGVL